MICLWNHNIAIFFSTHTLSSLQSFRHYNVFSLFLKFFHINLCPCFFFHFVFSRHRLFNYSFGKLSIVECLENRNENFSFFFIFDQNHKKNNEENNWFKGKKYTNAVTTSFRQRSSTTISIEKNNWKTCRWGNKVQKTNSDSEFFKFQFANQLASIW